MPIQTKICGLTTYEAVDAAVEGGASFIGCVFFPPSPRYAPLEQAAAITASLPKHVRKVAVVVDPTDQELARVMAVFMPDIVQLHGKESLERLIAIRDTWKIPVIKALVVAREEDLVPVKLYESVADWLLFDAKPPEGAMLPGGNGVAFDWHMLEGQTIRCPWFLSGGLTCQNVEEAVSISGAKYVDVSSGVEVRPGVKSIERIQEFLEITASL